MKQPSYLKGVLLFIGVTLIVSLISVSGNFGMWLTLGILASGAFSLFYSLTAQIKNAIIKPAHRLYAKDY